MTDEQAKIMGKAIGEAMGDKLAYHLPRMLNEAVESMKDECNVGSGLQQLGWAIGEGISKK
jgi:hypothetical protein